MDSIDAADSEMPPSVKSECPVAVDQKILPAVQDFFRCAFPLLDEKSRDALSHASFFLNPDQLESALLSESAFAAEPVENHRPHVTSDLTAILSAIEIGRARHNVKRSIVDLASEAKVSENHLVRFQDLSRLLTAEDQKAMLLPSNASLPLSIPPASLIDHVTNTRKSACVAIGVPLDLDEEGRFSLEAFKKRAGADIQGSVKRRRLDPTDFGRQRLPMNPPPPPPPAPFGPLKSPSMAPAVPGLESQSSSRGLPLNSENLRAHNEVSGGAGSVKGDGQENTGHRAPSRTILPETEGHPTEPMDDDEVGTQMNG